MNVLADIVVAFVAILHAAFLVLEMFLSTKPIGQRIFGLPTQVMASSSLLPMSGNIFRR